MRGPVALSVLALGCWAPGSPLFAQVQPPVVTGVTASPASGSEGDPLVFTAEVENPSGRVLRYAWDMGDGSEPRGGEGLSSLTHVFGDDGSFTVTVVVDAGEGLVAEGSTTVTLSNAAPELPVLTGPEEGAVDEPISLEGVARDPGADDVLTWSWDFGDGSTESGPDLREVTHAFSEPGLHPVRVTVEDDDGISVSRTLLVPVERTAHFELSGAVQGVMEGDFDGRPGFLVHGSGASDQVPGGYCQLVVSAEGEEGTSLTLAGTVPVPLAPGSFPVVRQGGPGTFRLQDMQCGRPGVDCSNGLWRGAGVSGSVTLTRASPERIDGEVDAAMAFGDQTYGITGFFTSVPQRMAGVALGRDPTCFDSGRFAVESHLPEADRSNVDPGEPGVIVTFTDPVDPGSVTDETFRVEYRLPDGAAPPYRPIDGVVDHPDDRTVRFTPARPLPDGILPCVRIRGGRDGVRSAAGDTLETPATTGTDEVAAATSGGVLSRTARACYGGGRPWPRAYEWGFATLVELEEVRVSLYQVAQVESGVSLVPEKLTAARVHPLWSEKDSVHPDAQVVRFPARIVVESEGGAPLYPGRERIEVRRPDRFDANERRLAENSVNFFGWRPSRSGPTRIRARLEPLEQRTTPPRVFEGAPLEVEYWDHTPRFTFDYYFLRVGEWADGVPPASRSGGDILARRTETYTTQMFPVIETAGRPAGDFQFGASADDGPAEIILGRLPGLPQEFRRALGQRSATKNMRTLIRLFTDQVGPVTDATSLVAYVPSSYAGGGGSHVQSLVEDWVAAGRDEGAGPVPFRSIHINPRGDIYLTSALTHEFGHAFWLQHIPWVNTVAERAEECANERGVMSGIEGMRLALEGDRGWSKSSTDGNAESERRLYPLMYPCAQRVEESFITNEAYVRLQEDMDAAIRLGFFRGAAVARSAAGGDGGGGSDSESAYPYGAGWSGSGRPGWVGGFWRQEAESVLIVSGLVRSGGSDGPPAWVGPVRRAPARTPTASLSDGPYQVVLRDGAGEVLRSVEFGLLPDENPVPAEPVGYFSVGVPRAEGVRAVSLERDGVEIGRRDVSGSPPRVALTNPAPGTAVPWSGMVAWDAADADGDPLLVSVLYSPTGARPWTLLGTPASGSELTVDPELLAAGRAPTLRVLVSDGFHESEVRARVTLQASDTVLDRDPASTGAQPGSAESEPPLADPAPDDPESETEAAAPATYDGPVPAEAIVLQPGEAHRFGGGHSVVVHGVRRRVRGELGLMGGAETLEAAVLDVEVCAGPGDLPLPAPTGSLFGLWVAEAGETHHGWSGDGVAWQGEPTFGRPMMEPALPAGSCLRGPIPVAERPGGGGFDAAVFDTRPHRSVLTAGLVTYAAWMLTGAPGG